jgi:hypothetical protein
MVFTVLKEWRFIVSCFYIEYTGCFWCITGVRKSKLAKRSICDITLSLMMSRVIECEEIFTSNLGYQRLCQG